MPLRDEVLELIERNPGIDVEEIAETLKADDVEVFEIVRALRREGLVGEA